MGLNDFYSVDTTEAYPLFDKIIDVQFVAKDEQGNTTMPLLILCPEGGLKPSIKLSLDMLPGGVALQFKLSITNLVTDIDISKFTHMVITVGYRTAKINKQFTAAIFSAYIETPNPNGVTTFTGLVGDWFIAGLREVAREIIFYEPTITVGELLWGIVAGKEPPGPEHGKTGAQVADALNGGLGLNLDVDLPSWVLRDKLVVGKPGQRESRYWTESGYACFNWLLDRLSAYSDALVATMRNGGMSSTQAEKYKIMAVLQDNQLSVFMQGFTTRNEVKRSVSFVEMQNITSVTFQGAALSVIAPWNPLIIPGSLFHMESRYFRGKMSPQQVIDQVARDRADLYRVITMSMEFDTNGSSNNMKLLAIRNEAFTAYPESATVKAMTAVEKETTVKTTVYVEDGKSGSMAFGRPRPKEEGEKKSRWGVTPGLFADSECDLITSVPPSYSLGSLATRYYFDKAYYKEPAEGNIDYPREHVSGTYFWPLIVIANYSKALEGIDGFKIYALDPLRTYEGHPVLIPKVNASFNHALDAYASRLHDIFIAMADDLEQHPDNNSGFSQQDIRALRVMAYYMELA